MAGKPKPTELKKLLGTRKDRINQNPPTTLPGLPTAPTSIKSDPVALAEWTDLITTLDATGVLSRADGRAVAAYCHLYSRWTRAITALREGEIVNSPNGYPMQSPWLAIANQAQKQMTSFLIEFGLTPSARSRVTAIKREDETKDKWRGVI